MKYDPIQFQNHWNIISFLEFIMGIQYSIVKTKQRHLFPLRIHTDLYPQLEIETHFNANVKTIIYNNPTIIEFIERIAWFASIHNWLLQMTAMHMLKAINLEVCNVDIKGQGLPQSTVIINILRTFFIVVKSRLNFENYIHWHFAMWIWQIDKYYCIKHMTLHGILRYAVHKLLQRNLCDRIWLKFLRLLLFNGENAISFINRRWDLRTHLNFNIN